MVLIKGFREEEMIKGGGQRSLGERGGSQGGEGWGFGEGWGWGAGWIMGLKFDKRVELSMQHMLGIAYVNIYKLLESNIFNS